jgi:hypothetical protein
LGPYLLIVILVCLFFLEHAEGDRSRMAQTTPLASEHMASLSLNDRLIWFSEGMAGKACTGATPMIAVERISFVLPPDTTSERSFAQMESLTTAGTITDSTNVWVRIRRSLIRGDSAHVAGALASGNVRWAESWATDPQPPQTIFPVSQFCPVAAGTPSANTSSPR